MFMFFVVLGMVFWAKWLAHYRRHDLLLSSCVFMVSNTLRYEGWLFSAALLLSAAFIYWRSSNPSGSLKTLAAVALLLFWFPSVWCLVHYAESGNLFGFFSHVSREGQTIYGDSLRKLIRHNPFIEFLRENGLTLNFLGIIPLTVLSVTNSRVRRWVFVPCSTILVFSAMAFFFHTVQSGPTWRIIGAWSILLLPFTAFGALLIGNHRRWLLWAFTILFCSLSLMHALSYRQKYLHAFPRQVQQAGEYLNSRLVLHRGEHLDRVLIESLDFSYLNLVVAAQQPDAFVLNTGTPSLGARGRESFLKLDEGCQAELIGAEGIRFLVFKSEDHKLFLRDCVSFSEVAQFGEWSIFEPTQ